MPYINETTANQIICIAKDYVGTRLYSFVSKDANGCGKRNDWSSLLCFYEVYRVASHRVSELISTSSYQNIIVKLLSQVALTPNYTLATCSSNVVIVNGGCGCEGGTTTTGSVSGCVDKIIAFHMDFEETAYQSNFLIGVDVLMVLREGVGMKSNPASIGGYIYDNVTGTFVPNSAISEQGEDFLILYKDCSGGGGAPIPVAGLRTGNISFNGNGVTTEFNIPHGAAPAAIPDFYIVGIAAPASAGVYYYQANTINIVVTFDVAPPIGTNNIILTWAAR